MSGILDTLELLCGIPGVSGCEDEVRGEILRQLKGFRADCVTDSPGNLIVFGKGAKRPAGRMLLIAHMDEAGLIITRAEEDGLLRFSVVGGLDARALAGKPVEIGRGRIPGVIGSKATHLCTEKEKNEVPEPDKLFIDIGASGREEAERHILPGERAVLASRFLPLGESLVTGRALEGRAGCALLIELLRSELPYDCHFAFTARREAGAAGAIAAGYAVNPDFCIVVDAVAATDISGSVPGPEECRLGRGPAISFMERGAAYDTEICRLALEAAEQNGIRCQPKVAATTSGGEARFIQTSGGGVRVVPVSLPCRYPGSPSCTLHKGDLDETLKLLSALISRPAILRPPRGGESPPALRGS